MKSLILIIIGAMLLAPESTVSNSGKIVLKKMSTLQINGKEKANLKSADLGHILRIKGHQIIAAPGKTLYGIKIKKGNHIFVFDNDRNGDDNEITVNMSGFTIIGEGPISNRIYYCSCGSAINPSMGDNCAHYAAPSGGTACGGGCTGENQGSSCSVTSFDTETGDIETHLFE